MGSMGEKGTHVILLIKIFLKVTEQLLDFSVKT